MNLYSIYYCSHNSCKNFSRSHPSSPMWTIATIDLAHPFKRANRPGWKIDRARIYRKEWNNRSRKHHRGPPYLSTRVKRFSMTRKFFTHLYNSRLVEDRIPGRLIPLHVPQDTPHTDVLRVDQTEGSDIDEIVLEVLEVEGLDILEHRETNCVFGTRGSAFHPLPRPECTYESCEEIVVLVVVHLQLQYLKADRHLERLFSLEEGLPLSWLVRFFSSVYVHFSKRYEAIFSRTKLMKILTDRI